MSVNVYRRAGMWWAVENHKPVAIDADTDLSSEMVSCMLDMRNRRMDIPPDWSEATTSVKAEVRSSPHGKWLDKQDELHLIIAWWDICHNGDRMDPSEFKVKFCSEFIDSFRCHVPEEGWKSFLDQLKDERGFREGDEWDSSGFHLVTLEQYETERDETVTTYYLGFVFEINE